MRQRQRIEIDRSELALRGKLAEVYRELRLRLRELLAQRGQLRAHGRDLRADDENVGQRFRADLMLLLDEIELLLVDRDDFLDGLDLSAQ